jgi:hypothetical protein
VPFAKGQWKLVVADDLELRLALAKTLRVAERQLPNTAGETRVFQSWLCFHDGMVPSAAVF